MTGNHKTPKRKYMQQTSGHRSLQYFFGSDSSGNSNKSNNKEVGLHKIKKILYSKGNHEQKGQHCE